VASNKVGHFIYSLRERVWPDFHCIFSLFRGDGFAPCFLPRRNGSDKNFDWSSKPSAPMKCMRWVPRKPSLAVNTPSKVLSVNAFDGSSAHELAKFGFMVPSSSSPKRVPPVLDVPSKVVDPENSSSLDRHFMVGSMNCSYWDSSLDHGHINSGLISRTFIGHNFRKPNYWQDRVKSDPKFSLFHLNCILDQRQAGYSDFEIERATGIWGLPSSDIIHDLLAGPRPVNLDILCLHCLCWGHLKRNCTSDIRCRCCFSLGHMGRSCPSRCRNCAGPVHVVDQCPNKKIWRIKKHSIQAV
jgi:hypothetical protein